MRGPIWTLRNRPAPLGFRPLTSFLNRFAMPSITKRTYTERAAAHPIAVAQQLLECIDRKKSNLCVSVDVPNKASLLRIAAAAGPYCCCIKVSSQPSPSLLETKFELILLFVPRQTHIDIVSDFDADLVAQLQALAEKHDFLIWEDRKFADIGELPPSAAGPTSLS